MKRGELILRMTFGRARLMRATNDVDERDFAGTACMTQPPERGGGMGRFDPELPSWDVPLQRRAYDTPFGCCWVIWPVGIPAPPVPWVCSSVARLQTERRIN